MVFKVRISLSLPQKDSEEILNYQFAEYFKKDYTFNLEVLEDNLSQDPEALVIFHEYFTQKLGIMDEIFHFISERSTSKYSIYSFELEIPFSKEINTSIKKNGRVYFNREFIEIKFTEKKYLQVTANDLEMKIYICKVNRTVRRIQASQQYYEQRMTNQNIQNEAEVSDSDSDSASSRQNQKVKKTYYQRQIISDESSSEQEQEKLKNFHYNHNGVLSNMQYNDYCQKGEQIDINMREKKLNKKICSKIGKDALIECNVCFNKISDYGLINCGHIYCFNCIKTWSSRTNSCPLCKKKFNVIKKIENGVSSFINVEDHQIAEEPIMDPAAFANEDCYVCKNGLQDDKLLICESCFTECCHIYCLNPKLDYIPDYNWYCDYCVNNKNMRLRPKLPIAGILEKKSKDVLGENLNKFLPQDSQKEEQEVQTVKEGQKFPQQSDQSESDSQYAPVKKVNHQIIGLEEMLKKNSFVDEESAVDKQQSEKNEESQPQDDELLNNANDQEKILIKQTIPKKSVQTEQNVQEEEESVSSEWQPERMVQNRLNTNLDQSESEDEQIGSRIQNSSLRECQNRISPKNSNQEEDNQKVQGENVTELQSTKKNIQKIN